MNQDVYGFDNSINYLQYEFARKKLNNPRFSLRAWARQLGYKNPAFLSQVLSKKRKLKLDLARKIAKNLRLSEAEAKYFETFVLLENARTVEEKNLIQELLFSIRSVQKKPVFPISLDVFKFVSDWTHTAILEVLNLRHCDGSARFVQNYMADTCSSAQVDIALRLLVRLGLVAQKKNRFYRMNESSLLLDTHVPSEAVRAFHTQMIQKALQAVERQSLEQRSLRASTLCFKKEDFLKAVDLVADLHRKLSQLSRDGDGEIVCQFNSQLFELIPNRKGEII